MEDHGLTPPSWWKFRLLIMYFYGFPDLVHAELLAPPEGNEDHGLGVVHQAPRVVPHMLPEPGTRYMTNPVMVFKTIKAPPPSTSMHNMQIFDHSCKMGPCEERVL